MERRFDEFIDSPDIREYNKEHSFTPAEWAVLIGMSRNKTAEKKLEAWEWLLENYDRDSFGLERVQHKYTPCAENDFYHLLETEVAAWKEALAYTKRNDAIFTVFFFDENDKAVKDMSGSFEEARDYILGYLELFEKLPECSFCINCYERVDERLDQICEYDISDMGMIYGIKNWKAANENDVNLWAEEHFIDVPLPFKVGDIIMYKRDFHFEEYGVIASLRSDEHTKRNIANGDSSCMNIRAYSLKNDIHAPNGIVIYEDEEVDPLGVEICEADDLPKDKKYLEVLSAGLKGKLDPMYILSEYSCGEFEYLYKRVKKYYR